MANDLTVHKQQRGIATQDALQWTDEQIQLLKDTICKGATDDELALFLHAAKRTRLDPFMRQIHAVKRWDSQQKRMAMSIQVGIDGLRTIADRTGRYAGNDDPVFSDKLNEWKAPEWARVTVYKLIDGVRCPFTATARWSEYVALKKDTGAPNKFWAEKPHIMLGKCAEALALRKAFPQELSGLYSEDEMEQASNPNRPTGPAKPALTQKPGEAPMPESNDNADKVTAFFGAVADEEIKDAEVVPAEVTDAAEPAEEPIVVPEEEPEAPKPEPKKRKPKAADGINVMAQVVAFTKAGRTYGKSTKYGVLLKLTGDDEDTIAIKAGLSNDKNPDKDGNYWSSTWSKTVWEAAPALKGKQVYASFEQNKQYWNLVDLTEAGA